MRYEGTRIGGIEKTAFYRYTFSDVLLGDQGVTAHASGTTRVRLLYQLDFVAEPSAEDTVLLSALHHTYSHLSVPFAVNTCTVIPLAITIAHSNSSYPCYPPRGLGIPVQTPLFSTTYPELRPGSTTDPPAYPAASSTSFKTHY